jgi:FAD/FMN-containing dehydrogenase
MGRGAALAAQRGGRGFRRRSARRGRRRRRHATLFRAAQKDAGAFAPLPAVLARLHRDLKRAFDPAGILNPGRLYPEF